MYKIHILLLYITIYTLANVFIYMYKNINFCIYSRTHTYILHIRFCISFLFPVTINYHKHGILKQHKFITLQMWRSVF